MNDLRINPAKLHTACNERTQPPSGAYFLLGGVKKLPLTERIVNIGRHGGNQIVLADPRVSLTHAQLRALNGHYLLRDLASEGGILVNGQPVDQCILHPGDIVSLAGYVLVFGED
jgi:pSer/pThr/pTyr-binding forkhead associated (FHA) protein